VFRIMKKITKTAEATKAYGKKLAEPFKYEFTFEAYENGEELIRNNAQLSIPEQVKARNAQELAKQRQAALVASLDARGIVKPTQENDPKLRLTNLFDTLMSSKLYSQEQAREMAATMLKLDWNDMDDDE